MNNSSSTFCFLKRSVCIMLVNIAVALAPRWLLEPLLIFLMSTRCLSSLSLMLLVESISGSVTNLNRLFMSLYASVCTNFLTVLCL